MTSTPSSATPQDDTGRIREDNDGCKHSWKFDGDNAYIVCYYCNEMRDAIDGAILRHSRGNDMATDHSDATTEPFKAAPSPTIDTELDGIVLKPAAWMFDDYAKAKQKLKALIERETARARIDELERLNFQEASGFLSGGNMILRQSVVTKRIAALTSPHERKDDK